MTKSIVFIPGACFPFHPPSHSSIPPFRSPLHPPQPNRLPILPNHAHLRQPPLKMQTLRPPTSTSALLLVDHGSKRPQANDMLCDLAGMLRTRTKLPIYTAHMELADPSIPDVIEQSVQNGATHIIVLPFFLSPGRHTTTDIPEITAKAMKEFPHVTHEVCPAIGTHPGIVDVLLDRAGLL